MPRVKLPVPKMGVPDPPTFIGVDPGLDGGVAWIEPDGKAGARVTPVIKQANGKRALDRNSLVVVLQSFGGHVCVAIEKVNAAPMRGRRQGTTSMFRFGEGYGLWLGVLAALGITPIEVDPRVWKKAVLAGTKKDKDAAVWFARTVFPDVSLLASKRCKKAHDGIADALCLAEYARRVHKMRAIVGV